MDVGAQRNDEVADLFTDSIRFGTFQVDRDGGSGRLGPQGRGIAGDLVLHQREGVFTAEGAGHHELYEQQEQMHGDDHQENFPQYTQDDEGLAGTGHVHERTADVQRQQGHDGVGQNLVDDGREIFEAVIQGIPDGLAPQGRQAQADDEGQHHSGDGVQDGRDGDGEERRQALARGLGQFIQHPGADEGREQVVSYKEGERTAHQSGTVGDAGRDQKELAGALAQVGDAHGHIGQDHHGNDEFQEVTEDTG